ncbi:hypothetical protein J2K03_12840, partial [Staphylococcus aureus]|nr:hypothetical protein [Staphylococcus aureus]
MTIHNKALFLYGLINFIKNDQSIYFYIKKYSLYIMVLHQMWWVYNLKNYFKLQLLEFLLLGGQSIIGLGCLLFFSFV